MRLVNRQKIVLVWSVKLFEGILVGGGGYGRFVEEVIRIEFGILMMPKSIEFGN